MLRFTLFFVLSISTTRQEECRYDQRLEESNIVKLLVEKGALVTEGLVSECKKHKIHDCTQILAGVSMRYPHVSLQGKAPYPIQMLVQQPWQDSCHRLTLSDTTIGIERQVIFDAHDNAQLLSETSCTGISAPHCITSVAERMALAKGLYTCPAARARRAAAKGHPCAGPWQSTQLPTEPTKAKCVQTLGLDNTTTIFANHGTTCFLERLIVRDGKWYRFVLEEHDQDVPPFIFLGTRVDNSPVLEIQPVYLDQLKKEPLLTLSDTILYALIARWDPFDKGQGHGHTLHDVALPLLWALFSLGEWSPGIIQPILLDDHLALPSDIWLATLSKMPPLYKHELASMLCPPHHWCILPRAVAGIDNRSYFALHLHDTIRPDPDLIQLFGRVTAAFARFASNNIRLALPSKAPFETPPIFKSNIQVLIVQRLHSRVLTNANEIALTLSLKANWSASILVLDYLTPQEQLSAFASAHLIVAVEGGAVDLLLLTDSTKAVVLIGRNPLIPWPEGCSGCGPEEQFSHANFLAATNAWLASVKIPCCGPISTYTPDPFVILAAARIALEKKRRLDGAIAEYCRFVKLKCYLNNNLS